MVRADGTPGPEPCSRDALKAMQILRLHTGESAWIDLDMNHVGVHNLVVYDGPSRVDSPNHWVTPWRPEHASTGRSGPAALRCDPLLRGEALDMGTPIPICAVARLGADQLRKKPGPSLAAPCLITQQPASSSSTIFVS